jgi:hypothetical protein
VTNLDSRGRNSLMLRAASLFAGASFDDLEDVVVWIALLGFPDRGGEVATLFGFTSVARAG